MRLVSNKEKPKYGWRYTVPETGHQHVADTYAQLVDSVVSEMKFRQVVVPSNIEDLIQNSICDQNGNVGCTEFGVGDFIRIFAQPIAKVIDKVAGTKLESCGGCAKRRAMLNSLGGK
jgi:hypothetical protein